MRACGSAFVSSMIADIPVVETGRLADADIASRNTG
jgi:hypothetical protein